MKTIIAIILSLFAISGWGQSSALRGFKTDYCTNYPEGTKKNPDQWKHCCLMHDMLFWAGGNQDDRDSSDLGLKACIAETGAPRVAELMYWAVRAGSHSPIKYPDKKWNNGWPQRPDFQTLSVEDVDLIENNLRDDYDYIPLEIKARFINQLRSRLE